MSRDLLSSNLQNGLATVRLKQEFQSRHEKNPSYSLRAFARDIGVSSGQLSRLLNGTRSFTAAQILKIGVQLSWTDTPRFRKSKSSSQNKFGTVMQNDLFALIYSWQCFAVLQYLQTPEAKKAESTAEQIQLLVKRLGITLHQARDTLERLEAAQMIQKNDQGIYAECAGTFEVKRTSALSRAQIAEHHRQMIERALVLLKDPSEAAVKQRHIVGQTLTLSKQSVERLKVEIELLRSQAVQWSVSDQAHQSNTEVIQVNVQLFSHIKSRKK
jgi:uncharacterized protein (TIGR02147 family)